MHYLLLCLKQLTMTQLKLSTQRTSNKQQVTGIVVAKLIVAWTLDTQRPVVVCHLHPQFTCHSFVVVAAAASTQLIMTLLVFSSNCFETIRSSNRSSNRSLNRSFEFMIAHRHTETPKHRNKAIVMLTQQQHVHCTQNMMLLHKQHIGIITVDGLIRLRVCIACTRVSSIVTCVKRSFSLFVCLIVLLHHTIASHNCIILLHHTIASHNCHNYW